MKLTNSTQDFDHRLDPRPLAGRLPLVEGLPLPPDFLPSLKGRLSLPLEPAGLLAPSLECLALPFAAPFEFAGDFDALLLLLLERDFFRGVLLDFLPE